MVDKRAFLAAMTMLTERHGRHLSGPTLREYKAHVDAHLTTTEFEAAARTVFLEDDYFPSPQRFVDVAKGSVKERALTAWALALEWAWSGRGYHPDPVIAAATRAAGGPTALQRAGSEYELRNRRGDFEAAYTREVSTAPPLALPAPELPGEEEV